MEYFRLTVRTGVPGYVDEGGGVHIEGFPQLVEIRKFSRFSKFMLKLRHALTGTPMTDRRDLRYDVRIPVFKDEFMVEIPLDIDISVLTGIRGCHALKLARVQDIDDRETIREVV